MSLFQKNVITKYLQAQDKNLLEQKWNDFKAHFHNATIQENIQNSKEEQYQEGFLRDLFVRVFGYTLNPDKDFNLTTELKNIKDSKKADGAIVINEKVKAVIELKGTNTTDLGKIEVQAFGYKNNQKDCTYVITSNFEKLRFYIENTIEFIEFNLFTLTKSDFDLLYLCLAYPNIKEDLAKKIKDESVSQEDVITQKLYKDYSLFKRELYNNLVQLNPQFEPLELFKKSQKLLDRFLFIFFAEDRNLLPTNLIFRINAEWKQLREMRIEVSLYDRYKMYFNDLNTGAKVSLPAFSQSSGISKEEHQIFAYNGGLFAADELLNSLKIDDDLLYKHTEKLSHYDFLSEVDVNILGHIFENSLNEIDEIKAELEGQQIDKSKTKRKKDGVFYTPKYITKYIVENTVGKLCEEKKTELEINDEVYQPAKQRSRKRLDNLQKYREWLLQITICDPACGSGAFLNQALEFLIAEHLYIDELSAKYNKDAFVLSDIEQSILENNLFGVDLNEESVQIARLSLWLRTARPNRRLNDLSSNIKCGNSLIDDPEIAGDKAFDWEKEFPQIFEKGGFDVIIGNPPYVVVNKSDDYKSYEWNSDLYLMFFELVLKKNILKQSGMFGFITPRFFAVNKNCKEFRHFLLNEVELFKLVETSPFEDANTECLISLILNSKPKSNLISVYEDVNKDILLTNEISKKYCLSNENYELQTFLNQSKIKVLKNIETNSLKLSELSLSKRGMEIGKKDFIDNGFKTLVGYDTSRYNIVFDNNYVDENNSQYLRLKDFFKYDEIILLRRVASDLIATYTEENYCFNKNLYGIKVNDNTFENKFVLSLLNSKLLNFYYKNKFSTKKVDLYPEIQSYLFNSLPIKNIPLSSQQPFVEKADLMLSLNKDLQELNGKFQRTIQREFSLEKLSKKLENWYELSYSDFLKELSKLKVVLSLSQKSEWEDYFNQEQQKAQTIKNQIDSTDKEIDQMVYELYGLSEEEIEIVENN